MSSSKKKEAPSATNPTGAEQILRAEAAVTGKLRQSGDATATKAAIYAYIEDPSENGTGEEAPMEEGREEASSDVEIGVGAHTAPGAVAVEGVGGEAPALADAQQPPLESNPPGLHPIDAHLVRERGENQSNQEDSNGEDPEAPSNKIPKAEPMGGSNDAMSNFLKTPAGMALIGFLVLVIVGLIVGLVVGRGSGSSGSAANVGTTGSDENESANDDMANIQPLRLEVLPDITQQSIANETSPQARAWSWLQADPYLSNRTLIRQTQRFALATLYYATNGEYWVNNTSWLDYEIHECEWYFDHHIFSETCGFEGEEEQEGSLDEEEESLDEEPSEEDGIAVGPTEREIVEISFFENNLTGALPYELILLPKVTLVYIDDNPIKGPFPTCLTEMSLELLLLFKTQLTGSIPTEIGNMESLVGIEMSSNGMTGTIPTEFGRLTNMYFTLFGNIDLSGTLPTELFAMTELIEFQFAHTQLSGTIPTELATLKGLETVNVRHCPGIVGTIPSELATLPHLSFFKLDGCNLTHSIPTEFGQLSTLIVMELGGWGALTGNIPTELGNLRDMERLSIFESSISGPLPSELGNLLILNNLTLWSNDLSGPLPSELGQLEELVALRLDGNSFSSVMPREFCLVYPENSFTEVDCDQVQCSCCSSCDSS